MPQNISEVAFFIVTGTVLVLLMSGFIVFMVLLHRNRQIQNKQHLQEVKQNFEKAILSSQMEMQEETLAYVGRELHDNVGQVLSLIKLTLINPDNQQVNQARQLVSAAINDLRGLSQNLNVDWADQLSLSDFIHNEISKINKLGFIQASFTGDENLSISDVQHKIIVFRLIQESLNNILKHAEATQIDITLQTCEETYKICLLIKDNGIGYDIDKASLGSGLQNMRKRSEMIGATLYLKSEKGKGSSVEFRFKNTQI